MKKSAWKPPLPPYAQFKKENLAKQARVASFIYQIGEYDALRKPSKQVDIKKLATPEYKAKIQYMKACMKRYRKLTGMGRAIAAVQLGFPEEMIAVYDPDIKSEYFFLINPKITKRSKELLRYPEMCMSAMPAIAPVVRPAWVEVEYFDEKGKKHLWNTKADTGKGRMYNRILQHEIDHLPGIINIDRVQSKDIIYESDPSFYQTASFQEVKK